MGNYHAVKLEDANYEKNGYSNEMYGKQDI